MKKFNLKKIASSKDFVIGDKSLQENRENMNLSSNQQGVAEKNINLSLPVKNKDNTVPFNVQLEAERKNETELSITEASMDQKEADFSAKDKKQVMDINVESQKYDDEKTAAFKKKEEEKNTAFWDKYVGVQLEGEGQPTKVKDNIPASASQLQNQPDRFKGEKVDKMVMASIKDADAMMFHIYATVSKAGRELNNNEKQQITDINSGKVRLMAQMVEPVRRSLEYSSKGINNSPGVVIKQDVGLAGRVGVFDNGEKIDEFKSCDEAKNNYPEGDIQNV